VGGAGVVDRVAGGVGRVVLVGGGLLGDHTP